MSSRYIGHLVSLLVIFALLACTVCTALADGPLTAKLLPQGGIQIMSDGKTIATLELNAHGPKWTHAGQETATATITKPGSARRCEGLLPVPNTDGGAVRFVEVIRPKPKEFRVTYELGFTKTMTLDGLQVSLLLPTEAYAGHAVLVGRPSAETADLRRILLPPQLNEQGWQLATLPAETLQIAPGADGAMTLTARVSTGKRSEASPAPNWAIQDLRQWKQDAFEARLFLIMSDQGKQVTADDKMTVQLDVAFPSEVQWE
jgi:hypothetical protein